MSANEIFYAHLISLILATAMVLISWRWRLAGRVFFVLLFLWAAQVNLRLAFGRPEVYLNYAPLAWSAWYREFILGFFARHITAIVAVIALGQLMIAILVALSGRGVALGLWGAIVFLLAIAPLGVGAGFPTTVIMAWAAGILLMSTYTMSVPTELGHWWRGSAGRRPHDDRGSHRHSNAA